MFRNLLNQINSSLEFACSNLSAESCRVPVTMSQIVAVVGKLLKSSLVRSSLRRKMVSLELKVIPDMLKVTAPQNATIEGNGIEGGGRVFENLSRRLLT